MVDLRVQIGSLALENPIMPGSGTFGEPFSQTSSMARLAEKP